MLGIITEDDDGNAASVHPQRPYKTQSQPKNRTQDKPRNSNSSTQSQSNTSLPKLDDISYKNVQADDGRMCVVATGSTLEKKDLLRAAGFKWNPQQKIWWKYADAA